jgi:hypothetical protein
MPVITGCDSKFYGVVQDVCPKINKVSVVWNNGPVSQHDPEEVLLAVGLDDDIRERMSRMASLWTGKSSTRRMAGAADKILNVQNVGPAYSGDPKTHGVDKPRGGGFSIMQRLQDELHDESVEQSGVVEQEEEKPVVAGKRNRRALYHKERGRVYRRTRGESENDEIICGKRGCPGVMELQPFTKSTKIYICPECGWKICTDKVV